MPLYSRLRVPFATFSERLHMDTIPFLVTLPSQTEEDDEMGIFGRFVPEAPIISRAIPTDVLKQNLVGVSRSVVEILEGIRAVGQFKLKQVTLQVEVSADGGINLVGTAKLGGKGAITLTFEE
jgi:hypothetical protein